MKFPDTPLINRKVVLDDVAIIEAKVWLLPKAVMGSSHSYKYRLHFGKQGRTFVRYDNERGKGDHRYVGEKEELYDFIDLHKLLTDFASDIEHIGRRSKT